MMIVGTKWKHLVKMMLFKNFKPNIEIPIFKTETTLYLEVSQWLLILVQKVKITLDYGQLSALAAVTAVVSHLVCIFRTWQSMQPSLTTNDWSKLLHFKSRGFKTYRIILIHLITTWENLPVLPTNRRRSFSHSLKDRRREFMVLAGHVNQVITAGCLIKLLY